MSKRSAHEKWTGDGRSPARRVDPGVLFVEGLRSAAFVALAALEAFVLGLLAILLWAGKIDGSQFLSSFKYGSAVVGLLGVMAGGRTIRGWIRSAIKSLSRTLGG